MHIVSIEPTPSPHTMKINLSEALGTGQSRHYKKEDHKEAPVWLQAVLNIDGVKAVYHVADFLALDRYPSYDWKPILATVRQSFGEEPTESAVQRQSNDSFGEISVQIQKYAGIPMQIKLTNGESEKRVGLPTRFSDAVMQLQTSGENVVLDRTWDDYGVRFGDFEDVGATLVEELSALYPPERLTSLQKGETTPFIEKYHRVTESDLDDPDWKVRYQRFENMSDPTIEDLPVLKKALYDEKASIRRLAVVYLGMIEDKKVLPLLEQALNDSSVTVRRTAGDAMSDLGMTEAIPAMVASLEDQNKIVRWRAAMFLYEVGDDTALPALEKAKDDDEFEVSLQVQMAIERISGGGEAKGSIWKQMTEATMRSKKEDPS
ncbi:virulence factor [Bacillaceae bacterium SIJ1]|uniref:conserved virulence factor C family protein n=1 Tax=Litoribacterium kuwaitense TaxID=1398745 RepID=UPI0013EB7B9E|nr:conserved virulence factor C family protein [Litoribacterium kuwaitense]NGP43771.1 virulence factor [Litoribacterium kuwaitense]